MNHPKSQPISMKNNNKAPSYHKSLDNLLFIPGIGHVAPDTYFGYGSLLDSDVDDDTEATSAFYGDSNTTVPDSIPIDVPECSEKIGSTNFDLGSCFDRSGDLSPKSVKFNKFVANFLEKTRKKAEENVKGRDHIIFEEVHDSVELSPKSLKFNKFYAKSLEKYK
ncbi:uncharacterized protein LOC141633968 [Silene latifolia]|uniref:uncharacterized protein LOC141633968 n=1 Tax=Silene latifolia TaxID=37657 RepID=UPI003D786E47